MYSPPDEETPVAWESADCHTSQQHIRIDADEYELEKIGDEDGLCWVAWIDHRGARRLLRAAYGRDEAEVHKRLVPAAQSRLKSEGQIGSQPGLILNAKIEMSSVEDFTHSLGFDPDSPEAKAEWLFWKYSTR